MVSRYKSRRAILAVRDTGIGIAAEDIEKIFEPKFTTKGTGMGYRGELKSRSRISEGSIFQIELRSTPLRNAVDALFNDLIGEQQERFGDGQTKPFGGLQVHHQTEFCRQLNGKVGRVCATQDAIDVGRCFTHGLQLVNSIRHQPAALDVK